MKLIDKQCFIDCEDIPENTATFNLNTLSACKAKQIKSKTNKANCLYPCHQLKKLCRNKRQLF